MKRILLALLTCIIFFSVLTSQDISWDQTKDYIRIADKVSVFEDASQKLTIDQVRLPENRSLFIPSEKVILSFGFTESIQWLHFNFDNTSDENLVLEIAHAFLPITELYYDDSDGSFQKLEAGYNIPLDDKIVKNHLQVFPLPKGKHEYFVRLMSHSHPIPVRIFKASAYEIKSYRQRLVYGFYLGFMAFVILSNLFFFVSLRNKLHLYYAGIVLIYIGYASTVMDGFILYFIPKLDLMFWYITIPTIGVPLQMIYALVFLEISKYSPKLFRYTKWLIIYFFVYAVVKFCLPMTAVLAINTIHALISFFMMGYLGYIAGKRGNRLGYYFMLAYSIYFILVLAEATYIQFGTPAYFAELSHVALATLIEAFLLSFLLSKRFEFEKEETENLKNTTQQQLLKQTLENEKIVKNQNQTLEVMVAKRTDDLSKTIEELKATQNQLIQAEKMASLGELTAGIAHEIQNPLNFVNNFSEVSIELMEEMNLEMEKGNHDDAKDISEDISLNLKKINHHGKRADSIVKGMLQHSRSQNDEKIDTDVNAICDEYLRLAYHGFRAKDKSFNATIETDLDPNIGVMKLASQDIARVILNLLTNAFYAVHQKAIKSATDFKPTVYISTFKESNHIKISIKDNGTGIPSHIKDKIYQPFFTSKPAGHGTGLGLSLAYEIIKAHHGDLKVESTVGEGSTFTITIPF
jgi:signal transduction histidine kinase